MAIPLDTLMSNPDYTYLTDPTDVIICSDGRECPEDSVCTANDIQMRLLCMCIHSLTPASVNSGCTNISVHMPDDDNEGVIEFQNGRNAFPDENYKPFINESQTTSTVYTDHSMNDASLDLLIKVLIPLAAFLVLVVIVLIVLLRYFRCCRKQKRGKNSSLVKASEGIHLLDKINVVNKNPMYFVTNSTGYQLKSDIVNIPVSDVRLLEVIGEGAFGQVYKGELERTDSGIRQNVAVKVLKEGVSNEAREDFEREVDIMSAFDHDNILKLIGTVHTGTSDTPYMVFEYMKHGDLAELLRRNDPTMKKSDETLTLAKTDLIDITVQIANGMRYLTSQHFVHRDLATRNCLVGEGLIVKISDFGMSRDIYTCDYYRIGGSRMLPVRWMSPEAVKWGRFTTDSDIWAFGVVLWEIFSYGRQPYYGHSNEEVIRFLEEGILLQRPEESPSVVYHVMLQCWKLDAKERLAFDRIHKYLTEYSKQLGKDSRDSSLDIVNEYEIPL